LNLSLGFTIRFAAWRNRFSTCPTTESNRKRFSHWGEGCITGGGCITMEGASPERLAEDDLPAGPYPSAVPSTKTARSDEFVRHLP
jgi:hypothetical protein